MTMEPIERLLAIEEIKQLKARYFRCLDTKDWDGLRAVFADDAVFDARAALSLDVEGGGDGPAESDDWIYEGGDAIAAFIKSTVLPLRTVHHGHCHEVEVLAPTEARGVIAMEDKVWDATSTLTLHGFGHYHETYRRTDQGWRIATSRLTRLNVALGD